MGQPNAEQSAPVTEIKKLDSDEVTVPKKKEEVSEVESVVVAKSENSDEPPAQPSTEPPVEDQAEETAEVPSEVQTEEPAEESLTE